MAGSSSAIGNTATLNLILGIFLKLLGFFVVLYVYTDVDPDKARLAEESLRERFNVSVVLVPEKDRIGQSADPSRQIAFHNREQAGRAMARIEAAMKSQIGLLATSYDREDGALVLRVPADVALDLGGRLARSPDFADILVATLNTQKAPEMAFSVEAIIKGPADNSDEWMRAVSLFIQKLVARQYPAAWLMTGYQEQAGPPVLELRIHPLYSKPALSPVVPEAGDRVQS